MADYRKKIAYAASFGSGTKFNGTEEQKEHFQNLLQQYDYVSVRERQGVELVKNEFGIEAEHVLDPVLICDKKHLDSLQKNATASVNGKYISTYFVWPNRSKFGIDKFAKKLGYGLINTINYGRDRLKKKGLFKGDLALQL